MTSQQPDMDIAQSCMGYSPLTKRDAPQVRRFGGLLDKTWIFCLLETKQIWVAQPSQGEDALRIIGFCWSGWQLWQSFDPVLSSGQEEAMGSHGYRKFPCDSLDGFWGTMTFIRTPPKTWRARWSYPLYKRFPSTGFAGACYYAVEVVSHPYFPVRLVPCLHAVARMKKMSRCSAMYHRRLPWGAPDWFAEA